MKIRVNTEQKTEIREIYRLDQLLTFVKENGGRALIINIEDNELPAVVVVDN